MKPSVSLDDTRRVLADIEAVVLQVEMARTAAAVERAIDVTAPGMCGCGCECECDWLDAGLPCETAVEHLGFQAHAGSPRDRLRYAPWVVSPHLFEEGL